MITPRLLQQLVLPLYVSLEVSEGRNVDRRETLSEIGRGKGTTGIRGPGNRKKMNNSYLSLVKGEDTHRIFINLMRNFHHHQCSLMTQKCNLIPQHFTISRLHQHSRQPSKIPKQPTRIRLRHILLPPLGTEIPRLRVHTA